MTRSDLIAAQIFRFTHLKIVDTTGNSLAQGDRIEIRGFGRFCVNHRPARKGRNPKNGEAVSVSAKYVPHFNAGKGMRELVKESARPSALPWAA